MEKSNYNFTPLPGYEQFEATTQIIIAEVLRRNLPLEIIDETNNLIAVTYEGKEYIIHEGTISDANSLIAYWISNDKWMTRQFLKRKGIRQANGVLLQNGYDSAVLKTISFPAVVKPADTDHGIAVSTNIRNNDELNEAVERAFRHSKRVIVEEYFAGQEYRFLVIDGKVRAIAFREPANITGDGIQSVEQLIAAKNQGRGTDYRHPLLQIKVDEEVQRHLKAQSIGMDTVLTKGEKIYLRKNSNLSTGGDSVDVTDNMPDFYKNIAEQAALAADLNIAGIDIIIDDWTAEPGEEHYIVVELNAPAMLSMHNFPYIGKNRQVEKYVLDSILRSK
ncbi:glutamate ligase [Mangrovibacterium diazotrophicum]|uniref:Glutamate--cysteine ligase n=1 Tax=Mangrovibacterium diazotrophicum TaxID=1261403 RepID=A0A419W7Y1_9BACT|nr:glutamate ligase [Mangrovibacterium diazotrophicum]RKD91587.1 glutamate--cysteine ligase [Mangrovibacterium diazotrophicum]